MSDNGRNSVLVRRWSCRSPVSGLWSVNPKTIDRCRGHRRYKSTKCKTITYLVTHELSLSQHNIKYFVKCRIHFSGFTILLLLFFRGRQSTGSCCKTVRHTIKITVCRTVNLWQGKVEVQYYRGLLLRVTKSRTGLLNWCRGCFFCLGVVIEYVEKR